MKKEIKRRLTEKIISLTIILVMFTMVFGKLVFFNIQEVWAANEVNVILQEIISQGELAVEAPAQVNFADFTLNGFGTNVTADLDNVNIEDSRGTGAGWSVTSVTNHMVGSGLTAPGNTINNEYINISTAGDITGIGGASTDGIALGGTTGNYNDGAMTIANSATNNGMGNYIVNSTILQATILSNNKAGTYQSDLTITIQ